MPHIPAILFPVLGQTDVVPAWWAVAISAVAVVVTLWDKLRPKPPLHRQFASREELAKVESAIEKIVAQAAADRQVTNSKLDAIMAQEATHYDRIMEAGSKRAATLHAKIDAVNTNTAGIAQRVAKLEGATQWGPNGQD